MCSSYFSFTAVYSAVVFLLSDPADFSVAYFQHFMHKRNQPQSPKCKKKPQKIFNFWSNTLRKNRFRGKKNRKKKIFLPIFAHFGCCRKIFAYY